MMMANRLRMDSLLQTIESSFSPNDFIEEIQARPAIWNHADPLYNNQASKRASWDTLIKKYHPEFDERPGAEQTLIASHYRRKWKSFRDSFARELAKIKNASKPRKTKYIYFNKLSFLLTVKGVPSSNIDDVESYLNDAQPEQFENDDNNANNNNNSSNINNNNSDGPDFSIFEIQPSELSSSMFKNSLPLNHHQSIKRESPFEFSMNNQDEDFNNGNSRKRIKLESDCWNNNNHNNNNSSSNSHNAVNSECDDEDKLFLLSLLSELKRVPLSIKLDVKCDLLNVFKNARLHYMPLSNNEHNNNSNNSMQNNNLGDNEMDEDENNIDDSPVMFSNNSNYCNANHINNKNSSSKNENDNNNNDDDNNDNSSTCNNDTNNDNI